MEEVPTIPLLEVTKEEITKIRKMFDIEPSKIDKNYDAVQEWCKKQDHLIEAFQYINRSVVERLYLLSQGSTQMTKLKIDKLLTTRGILSEITLNRSYNEFEKWDLFKFVPLPKLHPADQTRCIVGKTTRETYDEHGILSIIRYCVLINEFRIFYDYTWGDRYVWDLKNMSIGILTKINPFLLKKAEILLTEVYNMKVKAFYFINAPSFMDKLIALVKPFFKEKLVSRFYVLRSYEDLQKVIPKEILPEEYGGNAPSVTKLSDQWREFLKTEESLKLIDNFNKLTSDESKRNCVKFNEDYLGMPGSFQQMIVD